MKKRYFSLFMAAMIFCNAPLIAAEPAVVETSNVAPAQLSDREQAEQLMVRLHEIQDLTKQELSAEERLELRTEVKEIKEQFKVLDKRISISIGAIIIIALLLIILL